MYRNVIFIGTLAVQPYKMRFTVFPYKTTPAGAFLGEPFIQSSSISSGTPALTAPPFSPGRRL